MIEKKKKDVLRIRKEENPREVLIDWGEWER